MLSNHLFKNIMVYSSLWIILFDDAWKITSEVHDKHAIQRHLRNTKRKDLTESSGVVSAKYPPKVKLELLATLEC